MIAEFLGRLSANRVGYSNVIEISYNSSSAKRAAEIANAIASAYIADQLNAKFEANRSATSWLQERLRDLGEQALTAERAVSAYKSQNNIVSSGGKRIDEQQITDLNSRLVATRAQTSEALARLNRYEAMLRTNSTGSFSIGNLDAASSDALSSPIINSLRQQYLELTRRVSEWLARYGRDHLAVINLRTRMQDLRTSILEEVRRLAETSRSDFEVAKQRQQEIEKQLTEAVSQSRSSNSAELTIRELDSRAKGLRGLYETFLQRYMGSVQQLMADLDLSSYCVDIRDFDARSLTDRFASMVNNAEEIKFRMATRLVRNRQQLRSQFDELFQFHSPSGSQSAVHPETDFA